MPRIPRVRGLASLQLAAAPQCSANRASFAAARAFSTSGAVQGKNTDWIRGKLWKGEAPGPEDPYTQRMEPEETSNLPEEAREFQPRRDRTPRKVQNSRLALPPKRTEAIVDKQIAAIDPSYVPATFVEGLEEIDPLKTWWEQPGHWGEESEFKGFGSTEKVTDRAVLEVYLRRAVVETLALQETGLLSQWATKKWRAGERSELDDVLAVDLKVQDGKATLSGDLTAATERLTSDVEESELAAERISVEEARELVKAWDASWKDLALNDTLKFAISKRLYQLTGHLIPDAKLGATRTVKHILTLTAKPPKQEKLADILSSRSDFGELANVKVHSKKIGPIDKEISVGRWKVIAEELTKRGLPLMGTAGLAKNKERDWLSGRT
ncbi:hypothetical protein G7046_g8360 [Stylonectria norvegica]|nr:hypothetical protein G7046_g8360 [Stylonectria norvegica]